MRKPKILIIDDDKTFVDDLILMLKKDYDCQGVFSGENGLSQLEQKNFDLTLLDIGLGSGMNGFEFLSKMKENGISIPVIMITRTKEIKSVVKAMKMGAYDYFNKKPDLAELKMIIEKALEEYQCRREIEWFRQDFQTRSGKILGESDAIKEIRKKIAEISDVNSTVLITGESGTGKEIVARQIHLLSSRKNKPFMAVNCGAIPKELFESELFGHEKGAFTSAIKRQIGKFEQADKGTLFLDEIADMNFSIQAKLLRAIQFKEFQRVGGQATIAVDVRIIAATNKNLKDWVNQGEFREDLYYRLNVISIHIPPLRERRIDIPVLTSEIIKQKNRELKKNITTLSPEAENIFIAYDWPGNVRELENLIERAIIHCKTDTLTAELFPEILNFSADLPPYSIAKKHAEERFLREYIPALLRLTNGNISRTAERMGITRQGLQKIVKSLEINPSSFR